MWIFLTLLAALLGAIVDIIDKFVTDHEVKDPILETVICGFGHFFLATVAILIFPEVNLLIGKSAIFWAFVAGVVFRIAVILHFKALRLSELSRVSPLLHTKTVFVAFLALIFLGERFDALTYIGICLTILSAALFSLKKISFSPREKLWRFKFDAAASLVLLAALLVAIKFILVKYITNAANHPLAITYWMGMGQGVVATLILLYHHPRVTKKLRLGIGHLLLGTFLSFLSFLLLTYAMALGPVSLVSALSLTVLIFVLLFTFILSARFPQIIKEKMTRMILWQKLLAGILLLGGVLLITI